MAHALLKQNLQSAKVPRRASLGIQLLRPKGDGRFIEIGNEEEFLAPLGGKNDG